MIEHAQDTQLKQAFQSHLQETGNHVSRLKRLLGDLTNDAADKKDSILAAIVSSSENITKEFGSRCDPRRRPHRQRAKGRALRDRVIWQRA